MTQELEKAIATAVALPSEEQDRIAALILEEIESDKRWRESFARSQSQLARLAREAQEEYASGKTELLDPDSL